MRKEKKYNGEVTLRKTFNPYNYYLTDPENDVDDEKIASVTSITDVLTPTNPLMWWYASLIKNCIEDTMEPGRGYTETEIGRFARYVKNVKKRKQEEAKDIGNIIHRKLEEYTENQIEYGYCEVVTKDDPFPDGPHITMPVEERARDAVQGFLDWTEEHEIHWLASEELLVSREHRVGGTTDALAIVDGDLTIIDHKTSKSGRKPYLSYRVQGTTYMNFLLEEYPNMSIDQVGIFKLPKDGGSFSAYFYDDEDELETYWQTFLACKKIYDVRQEYD